MSNRKEVARWLREAAVASELLYAKTKDQVDDRMNLFFDRAAQVEAMCCETCSRYVSNEDEESCTFNQIEFQGKGFGCWSHKPKENPDPNE